jgi:ABC-type lipoprotein release transport system permease subunit
VAFAVARRMKEIGIRIALGANGRHVTAIVLWTGWRPIGAGLVAGMLATATIAPAVARMFKDTPVQIDPFDAVAYLGVAIVLATAGTAAMMGPCYRANSTEPAQALHYD